MLETYGLVSLVMSIMMSFGAGATFCLAIQNAAKGYRLHLFLITIGLLAFSISVGRTGIWIYMWAVFNGLHLNSG